MYNSSKYAIWSNKNLYNYYKEIWNHWCFYDKISRVMCICVVNDVKIYEVKFDEKKETVNIVKKIPRHKNGRGLNKSANMKDLYFKKHMYQTYTVFR